MPDGAWIREIRKARGWSQARLGEEVGVSQPMISQWERGNMEPAPEIAERIQALAAGGDLPANGAQGSRL